jgi:hypothetical protein
MAKAKKSRKFDPARLGEKKLEQLRRMPLIESKVFKTPDDRWIVHRTIISQVKPVEYYKAILENEAEDY